MLNTVSLLFSLTGLRLVRSDQPRILFTIFSPFFSNCLLPCMSCVLLDRSNRHPSHICLLYLRFAPRAYLFDAVVLNVASRLIQFHEIARGGTAGPAAGSPQLWLEPYTLRLFLIISFMFLLFSSSYPSLSHPYFLSSSLANFLPLIVHSSHPCPTSGRRWVFTSGSCCCPVRGPRENCW